MVKKILILGAGLEQSIAIKEAKKLNYFVIACDSNPNSLGFDFSDISYVVDINNVEDVYQIGLKHQIDGIFTHAVEIPHIVISPCTASIAILCNALSFAFHKRLNQNIVLYSRTRIPVAKD